MGSEGISLGARGGLLWAHYLRECLSLHLSLAAEALLPAPPALSDAYSRLWHLGVCSKLPPGPGQVPSTTGTSMSHPCFVCPQQSTMAAACTPSSAGLSADRCRSLRKQLKKTTPFSPCPPLRSPPQGVLCLFQVCAVGLWCCDGVGCLGQKAALPPPYSTVL